MAKKAGKTDITRNQRQARRREREKLWLLENDWHSWEALHTALLHGTVRLISGALAAGQMLDDKPTPGAKNQT